MLQRMRELAVQSSNSTNQTEDRDALDREFQQLIQEIDRIGNDTQFNKMQVLTTDQSIEVQIGANTLQTLTLTWKKQLKTSLGEDQVDISTLDIKTFATAQTAITELDKAIISVSKTRSLMGAYQNRLEHTINNLKTANENLTSAESRIRDTDMAMEMTEFTKNNILNQAAQAMLAQANQLPQGILQLLKS